LAPPGSITFGTSDLGISAAALYRWREQELIDTGLKPGTSTVASAELVAARRRTRELETKVEYSIGPPIDSRTWRPQKTAADWSLT